MPRPLTRVITLNGYANENIHKIPQFPLERATLLLEQQVDMLIPWWTRNGYSGDIKSPTCTQLQSFVGHVGGSKTYAKKTGLFKARTDGGKGHYGNQRQAEIRKSDETARVQFKKNCAKANDSISKAKREEDGRPTDVFDFMCQRKRNGRICGYECKATQHQQKRCPECGSSQASVNRAKYWKSKTPLPPLPIAYWKCLKKTEDGRVCGNIVMCRLSHRSGATCYKSHKINHCDGNPNSAWWKRVNRDGSL